MNDPGGQLQDIDKLIGELETQFTVYASDDPDISISVACTTTECTCDCTHACIGGSG